jgi:head-tail adaptor
LRFGKVEAGLLSDLIQLQAKVRTANADGQQAITWGARIDVWAEAIRNSETSIRFTIHYLDGITSDSHRVIFEGSYWTITNAINDQRRTMTIIDCDFSEKLEVTHLQSTTREFIDGLSDVNSVVE